VTQLTGHGLILREWSDEDLPALRDLFDDPDVAYRTPLVSPFDLTAARDYLADARRVAAGVFEPGKPLLKPGKPLLAGGVEETAHEVGFGQLVVEHDRDVRLLDVYLDAEGSEELQGLGHGLEA